MSEAVVRQKRGSTEWPDGLTPRAILSSDATIQQRQALARKGYRISTLTEKHLKIFRLLHPVLGHRFLPGHWLFAHFEKRSPVNFRILLRDLMREPNEYIYWPKQQDYSLNSGYKHGVYALTHKGAEAIGLPLPRVRHTDSGEGGGLYAHDLGVSLIECALKFGAREAGRTFKMGTPQRYRLPTSQWEPDGHPLSVGSVFIPGIEFERRPKGGSPEDTDAKLDKIIEFMATRHYEALGYANALIPIISTTEARTAELMEKARIKLGASSYLLFKTVPDWAREPRFPKPDGDMFTLPFKRVGHPPLTLNQATKGGAN